MKGTELRRRNFVVVITGASSGIGRATALRFARKGASVVLAARREAALQGLVAECERLGGQALALPLDVSDAEAVQRLAEHAVHRFGRIDVWINNAAVGVFAPFTHVPLADFRRVMDVNVMGYVYGCRAALEQMQAQGSGVIVNVSSVVGEIAQPYTSAYSMSKAAVRALSVSLRSELRLAGWNRIKVCTVLPATIDTPFFQHGANYTGRKAVAMPPVYAPQKAARTIVRVALSPRPETIIGPLGRAMALQHRLTPHAMETLMAVQVDNAQLSRKEPAPPSTGNIYESLSKGPAATMEGGWHGRRKTAVRKMAGALLLCAAAKGMSRALARRTG